MYYVSNSHPPIISKEKFEAVKSRQRIRRQKNLRQKYVLSRLLVCGECGHPFRRGEGLNNVFWKCSRTVSGFSNCTP